VSAAVAVSGRHRDAGEVLEKELRDRGAAGAASARAGVRHGGEPRGLAGGVAARTGRPGAAVSNAGTGGRPGGAGASSA
jgi:hypothetical protein